ncbi:hypothetical protein HK101_001202 [Irineochytrium annulatum]|nr:hypothetical protein HK101_001202 [Irineochytrium annulatum]
MCLWAYLNNKIADTAADDLECASWNMLMADLQSEAMDMLSSDLDWGKLSEREIKHRTHAEIITAAKNWSSDGNPYAYLLSEALHAYMDAEARRRRTLGVCHSDTMDSLYAMIQLQPKGHLIIDLVYRGRKCEKSMSDRKLEYFAFAAEWLRSHELDKGLRDEEIKKLGAKGLQREDLLLECVKMALEVYGIASKITYNHVEALANYYGERKETENAVKLLEDILAKLLKYAESVPTEGTTIRDMGECETTKGPYFNSYFIRQACKLAIRCS